MVYVKEMLLGVVACLLIVSATEQQDRNAVRGQFPYHVLLRIKYLDSEDVGICSGTLISDQWVLTSGHGCLQKAASIDVHLGSLGALNEKEAGRKIITVKDFEAPLYEVRFYKK